MQPSYNRLIASGAAIALAGYVLSGPAAFLFVQQTHPQPAWESPAVFAAHYHVIQDVPYYFGLLLIGGMLLLAAGHYLNVKPENTRLRFVTLLALAATTVFATLILFNYICQTTFVRHLALHYQPESDPILAAFSMANPMSLCWAVEMWGYGILGVATWLLRGYYTGWSAWISGLLAGNGVLSILGVVFTVIDVQWVLTPAGLAAYFLWNVLMIVLMVLIYRHARHRETTLVL
ncbi:MAG: hypothetical protein IPM36_07780 [Lewinellaceae bacterium]|nr:hypothetical protein [Lewinellaceae bacterium]